MKRGQKPDDLRRGRRTGKQRREKLHYHCLGELRMIGVAVGVAVTKQQRRVGSTQPGDGEVSRTVTNAAFAACQPLFDSLPGCRARADNDSRRTTRFGKRYPSLQRLGNGFRNVAYSPSRKR